MAKSVTIEEAKGKLGILLLALHAISGDDRCASPETSLWPRCMDLFRFSSTESRLLRREAFSK